MVRFLTSATYRGPTLIIGNTVTRFKPVLQFISKQVIKQMNDFCKKCNTGLK